MLDKVSRMWSQQVDSLIFSACGSEIRRYVEPKTASEHIVVIIILLLWRFMVQYLVFARVCGGKQRHERMNDWIRGSAQDFGALCS